MAGEGLDGSDFDLNSVDLRDGYMMAIDRLMLGLKNCWKAICIAKQHANEGAHNQ